MTVLASGRSSRRDFPSEPGKSDEMIFERRPKFRNFEEIAPWARARNSAEIIRVTTRQYFLLPFNTFCYVFDAFYTSQKHTKIHKQITKHHLDILFRTVSRGSRVPQGQSSEGPEKVREGWRRSEKVREGQRRLEKVKESMRKYEKV